MSLFSDFQGASRGPAELAVAMSDGEWYVAPHLQKISDVLSQVGQGKGLRIIIECPPRHGKSELCSVWTPSWFLHRWPRKRVILASYEADFAREWGRRVRDTFEEHNLGKTNEDVTAANAWNTSAGGGMRTAGLDGPITGKGADLLIIDDPVKNDEEARSPTIRERNWRWWLTTGRTRLEPGADVIVIMCMVGDTHVLMADGTEKALRDVRVGDSVATYDNGLVSTSKVMNWKNQGCDSVFKIKMKSGNFVVANERHPFLVQRDGGKPEWLRLREIRKGDGILRVTGVNGKGSSARQETAKGQPGVADSVSPITARTDGQEGSGHHRSTRNTGAQFDSSIGTESPSKSTEQCSTNSAVYVRSAESLQADGRQSTGMDTSASITATKPERFEGFCATNATSSSATEEQRLFCSEPLSTCELTLDVVVGIEGAGREDVFDIQVDRTESFIANGVVAHNTRWHEDDLVGRMLRHQAEQWIELCFPALAETDDPLGREKGEPLWKGRYSKSELQKTRDVVGPYVWSALYQQRPIPEEGGGQLWTPDLLDETRVGVAPEFMFCAVGVDPSAGAKRTNDEQGVGVCGIDAHGDIYTFDDATVRLSPAGWGMAAIQAALKCRPTATIYVERSGGGDMCRHVIMTAMEAAGVHGLRVDDVVARVGKHARAEPVASYWAQGRGHMMGIDAGHGAVASASWSTKLEAELCNFYMDGYHGTRSPNRADGMVWAALGLMKMGVHVVGETDEKLEEWHERSLTA